MDNTRYTGSMPDICNTCGGTTFDSHRCVRSDCMTKIACGFHREILARNFIQENTETRPKNTPCRVLSFPARRRRCPECLAVLPHMFHEPWCSQRHKNPRRWDWVWAVAGILILYVCAVMWWWEVTS